MELPARKYFMNFCEKVPKKCVLAAYHMRGLFRNNNDVVIRNQQVAGSSPATSSRNR